jgi:uncharacterized protein YecT (DUF1311 family)
MNACAGAALAGADASLNALYKQIQEHVNSDAGLKTRLVAAQRAWLAFRDAECKFSTSGVEAGSAFPMVQAQCLQGVTEKRIVDLKAYLNCQEGDLACPFWAK